MGNRKEDYPEFIMLLSYSTTHHISDACLTDNETYSSHAVTFKGKSQHGTKSHIYCGYIQDLLMTFKCTSIDPPMTKQRLKRI